MTKPYFETKLGKLYHGDCLEVMKQFPDNHFDLCLTDPPYGINEMSYRKNKSRGKLAKAKDYGDYKWDKSPMDENQKINLIRISKNQIVFGGNYFDLPPSKCWIVWDKQNRSSHFADCELAWTSFDSAVRIFRYNWNGFWQECMGQYKEIRYHPTQKPVNLFLWILKKYSNKNEIIIDPFAGSGTTGIACEKLGLKYVIIEQIEKYCEIAAERIKAESQQGKLFDTI